MKYNVKVIEYPNDSVQVRMYSEPVRTDFIQELKEQYVLNPFTDKVDKVKLFIPKCENAKTEEMNKRRNANRSKNMVYTYARCVNWEWFITLTFNNDMADRYDYKECSKKVREWLNNQRKRFAPNLKYLVVPEQHKDGAWHFHGLLADTEDMIFTYSGHKKNDDMIYNMDKYKYGFTTATKVKDVQRVSKYIGKYITKTMYDNTKGSQRYFVSQNIKKPVEITYINEDPIDKFLTKLSDSLGKNVTYVSCKTDNAYNNCQYIEMI